MPKQSQLVVSALISISAAVSPALAEDKRSVALIPGVVSARLAPAVVVRANSDRPSAAKVKSLARTGYPATRMQRAALLKQKGDMNGALIEYLKAAQENPLQVRAFYEQAQIFKEKGYPKLAQSALRQALAIKPEYRDARIFLASMHLESGELSDATRELFRSLGLNQTRSSKPTSDEHMPISSVSTLTKAAHERIVRFGQNPVPQQKEPDAFKFEMAPSESAAAVSGPASGEAGSNNGAFSAIKQVTDDPTIQAILKKIPGLEVLGDSQGNSNGAELTAPPVKAPDAPRVVTTTSRAANDAPGAITVSPVTNDQIQQIMKQVQSGKGRQESWKAPNLLGWFNKKDAAPAMPLYKSAPDRKVAEIAKTDLPAATVPAAAGRLRKRRVAAWVDNFLDGKPAEHLADKNLLEEAEKIKAAQTVVASGTMDAKDAAMIDEFRDKKVADAAKQVNPLKMLEQQPGAVSPLPSAMPAANIEIPQSLNTDAALPGDATEDGLSLHVPSAAEFSQLLRKAVSWIPLSIFKEDEVAVPAPAAVDNVPPPLPPQAIPGANAEIAKIASSALAMPAPQPKETAAPPSNNEVLDSIINMMPKDIAASLAQALQPGDSVKSPPVMKTSPVETAQPAPVVPPKNDLVARIVNGGSAESAVSESQKSAPQGFIPNPSRVTNAPMKAPSPLANSGMESSAQKPALRRPDGSVFQVPAAVPLPRSRTEVASAPNLPAQTYSFIDGAAGMPIPGARTAPANEIPTPSIVAFAPSSVMPRPVAIQSKNIPAQAMGTGPVSAPTPYAVPAPALAPMGQRVQSPVPEAPSPTGMPGIVPTFAVSAVSTAPAGAPPTVQPHARTNSNVPQLDLSVQGVSQVPQLALVPPSVRTAQKATALQVATLPLSSQPTIYKLGSQGFKFVAPALTVQQQHFYRALRGARRPIAVAPKPVAKPVPKPVPDDAMTTRMKYLMENGTGSLRPGEAFMYSEETGEGVMFMPDGNTERRKLAKARDAVEVAMQRRPELLKPRDMQYNLSLLGKILKPGDQKTVAPEAVEEDTSRLSVNDILGQSQGFFGWLKDVFKM